MSKQNGFLFFYDWEEPFAELDGESFKSLFLAMLKYQRDGTPPPAFNDAARIISSFVFPQLERRIESSKCGKEGAKKRYQNKENDTNPNNTPNTHPNGGTISTRQDKDKTRQKQDIDKDIPPISPKGEKSEIEKRFLQFWEVYPRKQAIANARKAFEKINPDETLSNTIIHAVEAQKKCEQWQNSKYIPLPASWLNAEQWKDETPTATAHRRQVNTTPSNISLLDKYL